MSKWSDESFENYTFNKPWTQKAAASGPREGISWHLKFQTIVLCWLQNDYQPIRLIWTSSKKKRKKKFHWGYKIIHRFCFRSSAIFGQSITIPNCGRNQKSFYLNVSWMNKEILSIRITSFHFQSDHVIALGNNWLGWKYLSSWLDWCRSLSFCQFQTRRNYRV